MHSGNGYYVRLTGSTSSSPLVQGVAATPPYTIPLKQGYNWIGYLPDKPMPVAQALQSIDGAYQRVLSLDKVYVYDPALRPYSTLQQMAPGQGYLIYMNVARTLTYPTSTLAVAQTQATNVAPSPACEGLQPTPFATLIYGRLSINGNAAPAGTRVEAITPRGEVAGCFVVERDGQYGLMHVFGEDASAEPPIPGFRSNEAVHFRINDVDVTPQQPIAWRDDKEPHLVNLALQAAQAVHVFLPWVTRR
jgi:hypothetical protein